VCRRYRRLPATSFPQRFRQRGKRQHNAAIIVLINLDDADVGTIMAGVARHYLE